MGGCDYFVEVAEMPASEIKKQFRQTQEACLYDHGHSGYTGTFAEKCDITIINGEWEPDKARDHCMENNEKWGDAYAYHLKDGGWLFGGICSC